LRQYYQFKVQTQIPSSAEAFNLSNAGIRYSFKHFGAKHGTCGHSCEKPLLCASHPIASLAGVRWCDPQRRSFVKSRGNPVVFQRSEGEASYSIAFFGLGTLS